MDFFPALTSSLLPTDSFQYVIYLCPSRELFELLYPFESARDPQASLLCFHIKNVTFTVIVSIVNKKDKKREFLRDAVLSVLYPGKNSLEVGDKNAL